MHGRMQHSIAEKYMFPPLLNRFYHETIKLLNPINLLAPTLFYHCGESLLCL